MVNMKNKRNDLTVELLNEGYEYKQHRGGMYSPVRASEFVNKAGDVKYLNEITFIWKTYFWITDTYDDTTLVDISELTKYQRELLNKLKSQNII